VSAPAPWLDGVPYAERYGVRAADEAWRVAARTFAAEHVRPLARDADREGRFPRELVRLAGSAGLLGAALPVSVSGGGASALAECLIAEEIGAVDGSLRGFMAVQVGLVARTLAELGDEGQRRHVPALLSGERIGCYGLTEPGAGSDVASLSTTARPEGDDVVLDGEKIWITNGGVADVALVFATVDREARHEGIECYLVPTDAPGWVASPMPGRELGHRASNHAHVRLESLRVPRTSRVGPERGGYRVAMRALDFGRLNVAAGAVGIHRACLEEATLFARERRQFGRRIGDFQQVGATLADMAVSLEASRLLVHQAARLRERGLDDTGAVSAAKLLATESALAAATRALQILGARGYTDERPVERHYRDAIALTIYEGTSHIQRLILSRRLLGRDEERTS
jgi:alkylation response protein AidB-like acyl-CoA dehydrogenase